MTATPYPLPREIRESAILVGNATVGPYGPSLYKIFDTADVKVFSKALGATVFSDVTAHCTIAKVNPALAYDYFTVTFDAGVPATTSWYHQARRTAERSVAVTKAGTITSAELEKELSKQASAQSELRRDSDRSIRVSPANPLSSYELPAPVANKVLIWNATADALVNGTPIDTGTVIPATPNRFIRNDADGNPVPVSAAVTAALDAVGATAPGATGLALLAAASQAVAWALVASASAFAQVGTGSFSTDQAPAPRIHKMADRLFLDGAATFNGQFLDANIVGLSTDAKALHSWGPRDASMFVDSSVAGIAIVGHSESKKQAGWSGTPLPAIPSSAGVAGFAINNRVGGNGQAWGGYFDAVRLTNGFTVGIEVAQANFGSESTITPFNVKTGGADGGVAVWAQIGCGLDAVAYAGAIKNSAAGFALLSSYADNSAKARTGFVIANGVIVDRSGGSFVYEAFAVPERHQFSWYRASDQTQSAFIWADVITGSPVGVTFKTGGVEFTGGGTLVNNVFVGLGATGNAPYIAAGGTDTNIGLGHYTKGTGAHEFFTNAGVKQFEVAHVATAVNYLQAKGAVTTAAPLLSAVGTDTNIGFGHATKGTGVHSFFTNSTVKQFEIAHVASAVNYLQAAGGAAGVAPSLQTIGSDTNIGFTYSLKGTGAHSFYTNTNVKQFEIAHAATAVNYLSAAGGAAGGGVSLSAQGSDTNIALTIQSKGSGTQFFNVRSLIAFQVDGVASAVNRLGIINAATAGQPMMYVAGTDTNISGSLRGAGTGGWQFLDGSSVKKFEYNTTGIGFFNVAPAAQGLIAAATGTIQRTTFATSTVTLPQLAGVVMAIIADLRAYGLSG